VKNSRRFGYLLLADAEDSQLRPRFEPWFSVQAFDGVRLAEDWRRGRVLSLQTRARVAVYSYVPPR